VWLLGGAVAPTILITKGYLLYGFQFCMQSLYLFKLKYTEAYFWVPELLRHTLHSKKRLFDHYIHTNISNNSSFRLKHPGVPDGSDGSGGTSYALTANQTRPVAQAMCRVAYLPCGGYYTMPHILATRCVVYYARRSAVKLPWLCVRNVVTCTYHQNDTYVTLFAGVAVMH